MGLIGRLEAFLGSLATTSLPTPQRRLPRSGSVFAGIRLSLDARPPDRNHPCPFGRLTLPAASPHCLTHHGRRTVYLLAIAYAATSLGLGPG